LLKDFLLAVVKASNDYNAACSPNFDRAFIAVHARHYVIQVERFFKWLPGVTGLPAARTAKLDAAWTKVLNILFDRTTGLYITLVRSEGGLDWRRFEPLAVKPKRGPTEAAWEAVAAVIGLSGKTLRREAGVPAELTPAKLTSVLKRPDPSLVAQLGTLLK
jgi:hypothetical protein